MSEILRTDVTSVKIYQNNIIAGIGSSLNIFDKCTGQQLQKILCLNGQKIYGIVPFGSKLLIFGGKQFTVVRFENDECRSVVKLFDAIVCDDWIHSGVWIDENCVALLTAHNVVEYWNLTSNSLQSRHSHEDNSILYSGLLLPLDSDVLVLAGTVFSQVIVHCHGDTLHRLDGHRGVIFSISCNQEQGIIVTTSDDRSVRVWEPNPKQTLTKLPQWKNITITCKHELYGHTARVMRSCITYNYIISVGEDAAICFWENGQLIKKLTSHQNSPIWSVDADRDSLVTGGGDAAMILHPLTVAIKQNIAKINISIDNPKKVLFTARRNIIILNEGNDLLYYNTENNKQFKYKLDHKSTYKAVGMSVCMQIIAVADINGKLDVFLENCKDDATLIKIIDTQLDFGKILSLHWAGNRQIAICSENGIINVLGSDNKTITGCAVFELPQCKERWLTAAAVDNNMYIFGDRCGNVHVFVKGNRNPIKTFNKVHGRYGPTSIVIKNNEIISTGRNGTINYFCKIENTINYMSKKDLEFQWIEKFLDKNENVVCGFQERVFTVFNLKSNSKIVEVTCGGGHRSWDAIRYYEKINENFEEVIKFMFIKNSVINMAMFILSEIVSKNIINGSHSKEINCLKVTFIYGKLIMLSGGEDTTVRVTTLDPYEDRAVFKHLSNIKTIKIKNLDENSILVITGGGRAQICIKIINISENIEIKSQNITDYMIKGKDKDRKNNRNWRNSCVDFDPETRIVDLDFIKIDKAFIIFAGCSDAYLRVFILENDNFKMTDEIKYHTTCILKTHCTTYFNYNILVTCTTRGVVTFWDVNYKKPFYELNNNISGINSINTIQIQDKLILASGGDDNAIHLIVLKLKDQYNLNSLYILHTLILDKYHSSQITGLILLNNYLLSTSIDQRVALLKWSLNDCLKCEFVKQCFSDVADIQGMELVKVTSSSIQVCVFGKGVEIINIQIPSE